VGKDERSWETIRAVVEMTKVTTRGDEGDKEATKETKEATRRRRRRRRDEGDDKETTRGKSDSDCCAILYCVLL